MEESYTGASRYREQKRFLRKSVLVLQVQVAKMWHSHCVQSSETTSYSELVWRDARIEDLTQCLDTSPAQIRKMSHG